MNHHIPELKIEFDDDGSDDGLILLEQDYCGNVDRISIHQVHLRFMAEKCGLIATSDPLALHTIATLTRRLKLLRDRIGHLSESLAKNASDDLTGFVHEQAFAAATAEMAVEFCAELDDIILGGGLNSQPISAPSETEPQGANHRL